MMRAEAEAVQREGREMRDVKSMTNRCTLNKELRLVEEEY